MGMNPVLILGGILAMATIAIFGVIESPNKTTEILGFCGMITGTLLVMLKQDADLKKVQKRIDVSDDRMQKRIDISDDKTIQTAREVKHTLTIADQARKEKLDTIDKKVETIAKQTNGDFTAKLENLEKKITDAKEEVLGTLPKVIKEVVPEVVTPIVSSPPGNSPGKREQP